MRTRKDEKMPDTVKVAGVEVEKKVNTNTILGIFSFLALFATLVTMYNALDFRTKELTDWIALHETRHARDDAEFTALKESLADRPQALYRLSQVEGNLQNNVIRMDRMSEIYNTRFAEMTGQLSSILTQQALINATLNRLEERDQNRFNSSSRFRTNSVPEEEKNGTAAKGR